MTKKIRGHSGTMSIVFISFAKFYRRFIQGFSTIATSLTAMLKTNGSSVTSTFRVDDDEVVGGGGAAGAKSGESGLHCTEYPEDKEGIYPSISNHLIHPQVLPSFLTESRTDLFGCVSIIEASITS